MFSIKVLVTPAQIDPDYNHAHHTTVLCLLEQARIAFIESAGLTQAKLFALDLWAVISEIQIEYYSEVKLGEYSATCDKIYFERKRMVFEQRVLDLQNREISSAQVKLMWFSKKLGKAITPPDHVIATLNQQISYINSNNSDTM